jgi:hypothetical protein
LALQARMQGKIAAWPLIRLAAATESIFADYRPNPMFENMWCATTGQPELGMWSLCDLIYCCASFQNEAKKSGLQSISASGENSRRAVYYICTRREPMHTIFLEKLPMRPTGWCNNYPICERPSPFAAASPKASTQHDATPHVGLGLEPMPRYICMIRTVDDIE